ncbi:MAG: ROK family protein [Vicinamibacteria bacterium]
MNPSVPGLRIGIDLGGTKIEAIGIDVSGAERARRRVATPCGDYDGTLAAIAGLVLEIESGVGARGSVGVGMPGAISPASGLVKNANSTWLNGRDLRADLERILERPLRFANDANCLALSEATDGAAAGAESVFGVILGTGTGGGVVLHGRPLTGPNAIAGEWGHNPLPWPEAEEWPGPECYCGKRGCIETFTSGPGLSADHARCNGERLDPTAIDARAQAGDSDCEATLARYESRLARGLASVVNLLDPDVIVLGGGLSNLTRLYRNLPPLLSRWAFSDTLSTRIAPPRHGDSSGVRGAAWLWDGAPEAG